MIHASGCPLIFLQIERRVDLSHILEQPRSILVCYPEHLPREKTFEFGEHARHRTVQVSIIGSRKWKYDDTLLN